MNVKEKILKKIIRVDQAGELGAQQIYQGQKMIFKLQKNKKDFDQISKMAKDEEEHLDFFDNIAKEKKIRPTKLKSLFGIGAYAMGVSTALMGPKAAYVCTEAVEEIIEKHYQKQIDQLEGVDEELRKKLVKFRDDEVELKNTAIDEGSREAFGYSVLRKTINETTKAAIFLAERI